MYLIGGRRDLVTHVFEAECLFLFDCAVLVAQLLDFCIRN